MEGFGRALKESDFCFEPNHIHINHGSYGAVPRVVQQERLRLINELERNPDAWFRWTARNKWDENIQAAATFLDSKPANLVFVNNATTGCNAVLKSLEFQNGDAILIHNLTYNAVKNACLSTMKRAGGEIVTVMFPLNPPSKTTVIDLYRHKLQEHPNIKVVVLELISSGSAIYFPIPELISLCKEYGKLILVDGAHGPGHVPLNLETLGADFFVGNFHKWAFTPRGCSVLWIDPKHHDVIKPAMTGHGYRMGTIQDEFFQQGTTDCSSYFCVSKGIEYHKSLGGMEVIHQYCCGLLDKAVNMLVTAWKTESLQYEPDMLAPHMRLVELPDLSQYILNKKIPKHEKEVGFVVMIPLMKELSSKYGITTVCYGLQGPGIRKFWVRLSANVYNCLADYEKLRDAILEIKGREISAT